MKRVLIVGAGFAGLNAARELGSKDGVDVLVIDRRNHHLFQPLLYQVAMAGLSPAEIAAPIRTLLSPHRNIRVLYEEVTAVDLDARSATTTAASHEYDYLVLACGSRHSYFGHPEWEPFAPGLKTIEQATEIRRRVLSAFEEAEKETDPARRKALLTFVVVGGGPTGVELAGAIGEMSRFTLARDFRNIDPKLTRVILVEAGPRILPMFSEQQASRAVRDLEALGCQVWTSSLVTNVTPESVDIDSERLAAATTLWAAGVEAVKLRTPLAADTDRQGRVIVGADLSVAGHPEVFVAGDAARVEAENAKPLPGVAPVALQEGRFIGRAILREIAGKPRGEFRYYDKGQMATIGRSRAIVEIGRLRFAGFFAWLVWLVVHIYYLVGFKNRLFVVIQWAWSYLTFRRGARLIVGKEWRFFPNQHEHDATKPGPPLPVRGKGGRGG
jgi:NADH dehydrogenase